MADSFRPTPGVAEVAAKNIYFNSTPGTQQLTHTFPGDCTLTLTLILTLTLTLTLTLP